MVKKIYLRAGGWPSIGIFWGLLLWANLALIQAAFLSIIYVIIYTLIAMAFDKVTKLDFGLLLFWATGLMFCIVDSSLAQVYLVRRFSTFMYGALFVMAYVPVVFGAEPFTMAFAKQRTPEAFWGTDLFISINRIMTMVWAGLLLTAMLITLIPGLLTQIVIPIILVAALGIPFTSKFPDWYLKSRGMGNLKGLQVSSVSSIPAPVPSMDTAAVPIQAAGDEERKSQVQGLDPVKKALVAFGSPRGDQGHTFTLLNRFLEGMRKEGIEPEILFLHKQKIRACTGCFSCWTRTPGVCIHKDDMPKLLKKVTEADLIIYAQPLYYFSVPGITKNFMDRQLPLVKPYLIEHPDGSTRHPHREDNHKNKRMLLFSVCGFPEVSHFDALVRTFRLWSRTSEIPLIGELLRPGSESTLFGEWIGQGYDRAMEALYEAGRQVVTQGFVSRAVEQAVSQSFYPDVRNFRQVSNQFWDTRLRYEREKRNGRELPDLREYLMNDMGMFFGGMASVYNPAKAGDFEGILQFNINGDRQGQYYLEIRDHQCVAKEGKAEDPNIIIHTPWEVWQAIGHGEISGQAALMQGKYRVEGDMGLLLRMQEIFSH